MIIFSLYLDLVKETVWVVKVMELAVDMVITILIIVFTILRFTIIYQKKSFFLEQISPFAIIVYKIIKIIAC
jgi:hypothetical protein